MSRPPASRCILALVATALLVASAYVFLAEPFTMATADSTPLDAARRHDLTLHAPIPLQHIPTPANNRRLVLVGDIHGMDAALAKLLAKVRFDPASDHLVATGDMISKGPDSPGVVDRLMALGASAVRGNHEDDVLRAWRRRQRQRNSLVASESNEAQEQLGAEEEEVVDAEKEEKFLAVARSLRPHHMAWLAELPVILTAEPLPLYVVHGGLMPGVPLSKQDPWAVMHMRTLIHRHSDLRRSEDASAGDGNEEELLAADAVAVPVDGHNGNKWSTAWNRYQKSLRKDRRRTVVYGHDAKTGYAEGRYTFGLDTGCVVGGRLTALVVEAKEGGDGFTHKTVSVSCKNL